MRRLLLAILLTAPVASAFAWNATGHRVVAAVAEPRLRPEVRAEMDRLIQIAATPSTDDFYGAAVWADEVRRDRPESEPWHYINYYFRQDGKSARGVPAPENVVVALERFSTVLRDRSKPDAERADALRYVMHFVGDVHQPLHATARESDAFPKGDRGGNDFRLAPTALWPGQERPVQNLHALWDLGGGLLEPFGDDPNAVRSLARAVSLHPVRFRSTPSFEAWARESFELAKREAYRTPENQVPSASYLTRVQRVSADRLYAAGVRLADLLNRTL